MFTGYVVVSVLLATMLTASASVDFGRYEKVLARRGRELRWRAD